MSFYTDGFCDAYTPLSSTFVYEEKDKYWQKKKKKVVKKIFVYCWIESVYWLDHVLSDVQLNVKALFIIELKQKALITSQTSH